MKRTIEEQTELLLSYFNEMPYEKREALLIMMDVFKEGANETKERRTD